MKLFQQEDPRQPVSAAPGAGPGRHLAMGTRYAIPFKIMVNVERGGVRFWLFG